MKASIRALPSTVWLLGAVSFLNDAASEAVYPLLPIFLSSVLLAGPQAMGLIEGIAEATSSLLKLFSGVWVDRSGRAKPWVVGGYSLAALARPLIALATVWPVVLLLRFLDRVGKGLRGAPRDVLIANSALPGQKGLAFGLHRSCDHAGAVVGPLLASLLLGLGWQLVDVILFSAIPGALAIALTLKVRDLPEGASMAGGKPGKAKAEFHWQLGQLPRSFKRYLLALALFTLGNASNLFLLLQAQQLGLAQALVPSLWALVALVAMLFSAPLSAWSDRIGRRRLIVFGWCAYAVFYLALGWLPASWVQWAIWPLFASYGLFIAATEGVEKALVSDLVPREQLGRAFGWFHLTAGLLLLPASLLFGVLWQHFGATLAFTVAAAAAFSGALLMGRISLIPDTRAD